MAVVIRQERRSQAKELGLHSWAVENHWKGFSREEMWSRFRYIFKARLSGESGGCGGPHICSSLPGSLPTLHFCSGEKAQHDTCKISWQLALWR